MMNRARCALALSGLVAPAGSARAGVLDLTTAGASGSIVGTRRRR